MADVGPGAGTTDVATRSSGGTPEGPVLAANYPNPFNPATHLEFEVPRAGWVTLSVFNLLGQEVARLFTAEASPRRTYRLVFDATGLPAGPYFSRLVFDGRYVTRPMILLK
jgi:hypothetical protein